MTTNLDRAHFEAMAKDHLGRCGIQSYPFPYDQSRIVNAMNARDVAALADLLERVSTEAEQRGRDAERAAVARWLRDPMQGPAALGVKHWGIGYAEDIERGAHIPAAADGGEHG